MAGKAKVFQSEPISLKNGDLTAFLFHFKGGRHQMWSECKIAAKKLAKLPEMRDEILVFHKEAHNFGKAYMTQISHIGVIMAKNRPNVLKRLMVITEELGLEMAQDNAEVSPYYLQLALNLTAEARLAPDWNRVGPYYVFSPDFLKWQFFKAVKPQLRVSQTWQEFKITIVIEEMGLKWHNALSLASINADPRHTEMFEKGHIDVIPQQHLGNVWLNVLPKLTKAKLRFISRNIVTSPQIQDKQDMANYWKDLYGYQLPQDFGAFYCNVSFGDGFSAMGQTDIFCYPIECVRLTEPSVVPRSDLALEHLAAEYVCDLQNAIGKIGHDHPLVFPILSTSSMTTPKITHFFNAAKDGGKSGLHISAGGDNLGPKGKLGLQGIKAKFEEKNARIFDGSSHSSIEESAILPKMLTDILSQNSQCNNTAVKKIVPSFKSKSYATMPSLFSQDSGYSDGIQKKVSGWSQVLRKEPEGQKIMENLLLLKTKPLGPSKKPLEKKLTPPPIFCQIEGGSNQADLPPQPMIVGKKRSYQEKYSFEPSSGDAKKAKTNIDPSNIPGLASAGLLLKKSTIASLKGWLMSQGSSFKAKAKKEELVHQVLDILGFPPATNEP